MVLRVLHVVILASMARALIVRVGVATPGLQPLGPAIASPGSASSCQIRDHREHTRGILKGAHGGGLHMQSQDEARRIMGRREMVSVAGAAFAGCVLSVPQQAAAQDDDSKFSWRPVYGANGKPQWLGFKEAEETYPLRFIEYLTRILLNYDEPSRELFKEDTEPLSVLPQDKRQAARFEQFARFSTSVEYGLRDYNGTKGAARLARVLSVRFRDSPGALQQLGFLFTLMEDHQPVQEIERIMARWENATVGQILVQDGGSGYTGNVPDVAIKDDYGARVKAKATCSMSETGRLLTVRIKNGGAGYDTAPTISFPGLTTAIGKDINAEVYNIEFRAPQAEALVKDGKVVAVKLKDRGEGLISSGLSSLRVVFEPAQGELPVLNAEAYAVLDRKVDAIKVDESGGGYTTVKPASVVVQAPNECGGDRDLGRRALAVAKMKAGTRPSSVSLGRFLPTIEDDEINTFIRLYPSSVSIVYSNSSKRFEFSETSLLGFNVTTPYGPISQYSRRSPYSKEVSLDTSVYWRLAASGAICASIAHGLLVPLDTVKTRLQTAPKGTYSGPIDACIRVFRDEGGVAALLRGLQPEVVGFSIYGAFSFGGTEFCRRWIADLAGPEGAILYQIPILMLGSAMASVVAIAFTCPFMQVKTRLIADKSFAGGSLIKGISRIVAEEEWQPSLYGGLLPLMLKDVTFVLSKFVVFDLIKTSIFLYYPEARDSLSSTLLVSLCSGTLAGMVSAVTSQPGDYLFSKSSQTSDASLGSAWTAYWDGAVNKGLWADILTGLPPRLVFSGALIALQFVIYDFCRVQFHVSPNELMEFLDVMASVGSTAAQ